MDDWRYLKASRSRLDVAPFWQTCHDHEMVQARDIKIRVPPRSLLDSVNSTELSHIDLG